MLRYANKLRFTPALVLVATLCLAALAWAFARRSVDLEERVLFDRSAEEIRSTIDFRMNHYVDALVQTRGLFTAGRLTADEFRAYVGNMDLRREYPGMRGICVAQRVARGGKGELDLSGGDAGTGALTDAHRPAEEGLNLLFSVPAEAGCQRGLARDAGLAAAPRAAMDAATDSGQPAATGSLMLGPSPGATEAAPSSKGFFVYTPVYRHGAPVGSVEQRRRALVGFVYSPIRADELFRGFFSQHDLEQRGVDFQVYDGLQPSAGALLHDHDGLPDDPAVVPRISLQSTVEVAGQTWTVRLTSLPQLDARASRRLPTLIAFIGEVVSVLVFVLLRLRERYASEQLVLLEQEQAARAEAQRAVRTREDVLAVVSHDLKNPVSSILLQVELLNRGLAGPLQASASAQRALAGIGRAAGRMRLLIGDLLDLVRIDAGGLSLELDPVDAGSLVAEAIEMLQALAAAEEITLEAEVDPACGAVLCDRDRVMQVFSNLIGNAIKFSERGGRVSVRAQPLLGGLVRFAVEDTGPGIAPDQLLHVFDRFWQAPKLKRAGSGLGLFIAKGIVDAHRGTLGVESTIGRGTIFNFTLTAAPRVAEGAGLASQPAL